MELEKCKHSNDCGGCIYQGVPYQEQLQHKAKLVIGLLEEHKVPLMNF